MSGAAESDARVVIQPPAGSSPVDFRELWAYRELLIQLVWRDVTVRYKQAMLGVLWAVLTPLFTAVIFAVIFGLLGRMPTDGIAKAPFYLAGLTMYQFFSGSLGGAANSMVNQRNLLTKVYFPRIIAPFSATAVHLVDYVLAFSVLVGMVFYYGHVPRWEVIIAVPACLLWAWTGAFGLGLWLAALNVYYRDVGQVLPVVIRLGMFASPILYPTSMIPERWHWLYGLNPVVGAIEWIRHLLFRTPQPPEAVLYLSAAVSLTLLVTGTWYFRRMEHNYADVV